MKKPLSIILALALVISFSTAVFGYLEDDDMADDRQFFVCGENNEYVFVSVEFASRSDETFPKTGLYTNDEKHTPIYTMDRERRFENSYVSNDGKMVAFVPDYDNSIWFDTKCCEIYKEGKLINSLDMVSVFNVFSIEKLMLYVRGANGTDGTFPKDWCANQTQTLNDTVILNLLNGRTIFINLNNGTVIYTPTYFKTGIILLNVIVCAVALIDLRIKKKRVKK